MKFTANIKISLPIITALMMLILAACSPKGESDNKQGLALYNKGQYNSAVTSFEAAIAANKRVPEYYVNLGMTYIELENYTAVVGISSATKETLKDSGRLLLTTVTRSRNTGQEFSDDHYTMEAAGSGPQLMEPVIADITIKTGADENIEVYALDSSGRRKEKLEVTRDKSGYSKFRADGKKYKAVHYEIVK